MLERKENKDMNILDILNIDSKIIKQTLLDLYQSGVLEKVLPELVNLKGVDKTKKSFHKDNFYHTLEVVENTYNVTTNHKLRLASILHDIGKAPTKKWCDDKGWTFSNHELVGSKMLEKIFERLNIPLEYYDYVYNIVLYHGIPKELTKNVTESALRRFGKDIGENLEDLILFCKCDLTTKNQEKKQQQIKSYDNLYKNIIIVREKDDASKWRCPIDGNMIKEFFNVDGREIGLIKNEIISAIKSGKINDDYESAYNFILEMKNKNI